MKGKFIVIEGLEGAGKTTARDAIVEVLKQQGIKDIIFTREPGGTVLAEKLRELIKHGVEGEKLTDQAEVLMLYASRVQLVEHVIKPALAQGIWVIGDRHDLSSQAYQGGGRGIDHGLMTVLRNAVLANFYPDLTLYLDIDPKIGLERARQRGKLDRIEQESLVFFERIRQRYLELALLDTSIITINANQPIEAVTTDLKRTIQNWFNSLS